MSYETHCEECGRRLPYHAHDCPVAKLQAEQSPGFSIGGYLIALVGAAAIVIIVVGMGWVLITLFT